MIDERLNKISDCLYRVSARALIFRHGKVLLSREDNGQLCLPGGGIDHGESIIDGLRRELKEEIALDIPRACVSKSPRTTYTTILHRIPCLMFYYDIQLPPDVNPRKIELDFAWVDVDSVDQVDFIGDEDEVNFVKNLIKEAACES